MTNTNNKEDLKEFNSINLNQTTQPINDSILVDDEKTLNLVKQEITQRGMFTRFRYDIPGSFDTISENIFSKMQEIDRAHQSNIISRDIAIEMIADLFEGEAIRGGFERYADNLYLEKVKKCMN